MRENGGAAGHHQLNLAGEQVVHGRRRAAVRHMHHLGPGRDHEGGGGDMRGGAVAAGAIVQLARILLGVVDEFQHVLGRNRGMHDHDVVHLRQHAQMLEALQRIVLQTGVQRGVHAEGADVAHANGVAIGWRAGDLHAAHRAAGAGAVLNRDALAPGFGELLADDARQNVGRSTRGERHDHGHALVGPSGLRGGAAGEARRGGRSKTGQHLTPIDVVAHLHVPSCDCCGIQI